MVSKFTVGADPELFATKEGKVFPCCDLLGGDKWNPRPTDWGHIQEDNVMAEFNIPPAESKTQFLGNMLRAMDGVNTELVGLGLGISRASAVRFPQNLLTHPNAQRFGCDPDFCLDQKGVPRRITPRPTMRYAGGHVHVGYSDICFSNDTTDGRSKFVSCLDFTLGITAGLMDPDHRRKAVYGQLGVYREKEYGVEYRTPSNFWIFNKELIERVYDDVENAVKLYHSPYSVAFMEGHRKELIGAFKSNNEKSLTILRNRVEGMIR